MHFCPSREKRENHGSYEDEKGKSEVQGPGRFRFIVFIHRCDQLK